MLHVRSTRHASAPTLEIFDLRSSISVTAVCGQSEVFLCGAECPVSGHTARGGHDPEPGSDHTGPLRSREE